jgi:hypothetical protein
MGSGGLLGTAAWVLIHSSTSTVWSATIPRGCATIFHAILYRRCVTLMSMPMFVPANSRLSSLPGLIRLAFRNSSRSLAHQPTIHLLRVPRPERRPPAPMKDRPMSKDGNDKQPIQKRNTAFGPHAITTGTRTVLCETVNKVYKHQLYKSYMCIWRSRIAGLLRCPASAPCAPPPYHA